MVNYIPNGNGENSKEDEPSSSYSDIDFEYMDSSIFPKSSLVIEKKPSELENKLTKKSDPPKL